MAGILLENERGLMPFERDVTWEHRINDLKQFALFLSNLGYVAYIPVCRAKINRHLHVPYIFTPEQLQRFFTECSVPVGGA